MSSVKRSNTYWSTNTFAPSVAICIARIICLCSSVAICIDRSICHRWWAAICMITPICHQVQYDLHIEIHIVHIVLSKVWSNLIRTLLSDCTNRSSNFMSTLSYSRIKKKYVMAVTEHDIYHQKKATGSGTKSSKASCFSPLRYCLVLMFWPGVAGGRQTNSSRLCCRRNIVYDRPSRSVILCCCPRL